MVPGFMQLQQEDQITLLKSGSYGIMLLYAAQAFVPERNCFIYNNQMLNLETLLATAQHQPLLDEDEKFFLKENLKFICQIKQLNLSNTETAILSAIILFNPDNPNLNDQKSIYHTNQRFIELLRMDIENNRPQTQSTSMSSLEKQQLLQQILNLITVDARRLNQSHFDLIRNFKINNVQIEFPPLHKELFNVDYYVYFHQQQQQQQQIQIQQQHMQQQQQQQHVQHLPMINQQQVNNRYNGQHVYNVVKQPLNDNLNISSPSPSSCSSTSSSSTSSLSSTSTNNQQMLSLSPSNNVQQQANYDQFYYNNTAANKTAYYPVVQNIPQTTQQTTSPSSASSASTLDFSHNLDDVMCSSLANVNTLNKVNSITLQANQTNSNISSPSSTSSTNSSSISPPSYASLTSTYASLIKSEPLYSNSMSIGIDTV